MDLEDNKRGDEVRMFIDRWLLWLAAPVSLLSMPISA